MKRRSCKLKLKKFLKLKNIFCVKFKFTSIYNTQIKSGYVDENTGNFISIDASKRNHDDRLNDVINEFSTKKSGTNKHETQSKNQKNRSMKNHSDDDDDIVGMMDRLNK
jgi:formate dehydrogenase assembly factor FdhD